MADEIQQAQEYITETDFIARVAEQVYNGQQEAGAEGLPHDKYVAVLYDKMNRLANFFDAYPQFIPANMDIPPSFPGGPECPLEPVVINVANGQSLTINVAK